MNTIRVTLLVLLSLMLPSCKDEAQQEIMDVFDAYVAACDAKNGEAVLALIDDKFCDEMDHVLHAARTATADKVFRMRAWERMWIVTIRNRLTKAEMSGLTGRSLIKLSVDKGWDLDEAGEQLFYSLGPIKHRPPRATAELIVEGEKTGLRYEFVKVDNAWKIDPMCEVQWLDRLIVKLAARTNSREDMWIKEFESAASGKRINEGIWGPPK